MEKEVMISRLGNILNEVSSFIRNCIFRVLRVGPIPNHIAFIMDGNRRFAKKMKLQQDGGAAGGREDGGFWALMFMFIYCYELGVKYVTAYAFSIDNFKRKPEEVETLMDSMLQKVDVLTSMAKLFSVRVHFAGNLALLSDELRVEAMKVMEVTSGYTNSLLMICIAYSSTDEILHAVRESCQEKRIDHVQVIDKNDDYDDRNLVIKLSDLEKNMYMGIAPDPGIVIRTGGENRLSNFLIWQSCWSHLSAISVLWPEIGLWQLVFEVLNFQRNYQYFEKIRKKHL